MLTRARYLESSSSGSGSRAGSTGVTSVGSSTSVAGSRCVAVGGHTRLGRAVGVLARGDLVDELVGRRGVPGGVGVAAGGAVVVAGEAGVVVVAGEAGRVVVTGKARRVVVAGEAG